MVDINVQVCDAFVHWRELFDFVLPSVVDKESNSPCVCVVAGSSEHMLAIFGCPDFVCFCSPCFVNGHDVPVNGVEFCK